MVKFRVNRDWAAASPYERFFDFIAPQADRYNILLDHIQKLDLNSVVLSIEKNRHFFIFPKNIKLELSAGSAFPYSGESPVVLTAHYDRAAGSSGANDNSVSVFLLLNAALKLVKQGLENWLIIFTDKEELEKGEGIQKQGAYSLAKKLKNLGLGNSRIFNFDTCGTGDTFILSSTADYLIQKKQKPGLFRAAHVINYLRDRAYTAARNRHLSNVMTFPTPFSDDAGFLGGGIPVQTITILPAAEAGHLAALLRTNPSFADVIISGPAKGAAERHHIPETWRCLNSPSDSYLRLTPDYYEKIVLFMTELVKI